MSEFTKGLQTVVAHEAFWELASEGYALATIGPEYRKIYISKIAYGKIHQTALSLLLIVLILSIGELEHFQPTGGSHGYTASRQVV